MLNRPSKLVVHQRYLYELDLTLRPPEINCQLGCGCSRVLHAAVDRGLVPGSPDWGSSQLTELRRYKHFAQSTRPRTPTGGGVTTTATCPRRTSSKSRTGVRHRGRLSIRRSSRPYPPAVGCKSTRAAEVLASLAGEAAGGPGAAPGGQPMLLPGLANPLAAIAAAGGWRGTLTHWPCYCAGRSTSTRWSPHSRRSSLNCKRSRVISARPAGGRAALARLNGSSPRVWGLRASGPLQLRPDQQR